MKTNDYLKEYKRLKNELRNDVKRMSFGKMVAQNIEDILPKQWKLEPDNYRGDLRISPRGDALTADRFDKLLAILSRHLQSEPTKRIDKKTLYAYFVIYRTDTTRPVTNYKAYSDYNVSIRIEINVNNTESCEIVTETVTETVERTTLTGYCKAIAEKHYLNER